MEDDFFVGDRHEVLGAWAPHVSKSYDANVRSTNIDNDDDANDEADIKCCNSNDNKLDDRDKDWYSPAQKNREKKEETHLSIPNIKSHLRKVQSESSLNRPLHNHNVQIKPISPKNNSSNTRCGLITADRSIPPNVRNGTAPSVTFSSSLPSIGGDSTDKLRRNSSFPAVLGRPDNFRNSISAGTVVFTAHSGADTDSLNLRNGAGSFSTSGSLLPLRRISTVGDSRQRRGTLVCNKIVVPLKDIVDDIAAFIHRKFGESKKFSQTDKQGLVLMTSVNIQRKRDEFKRLTSRLSAELDIEQREERQKDKLVMSAAYELHAFVSGRASQLSVTPGAQDLVTTTEHLARITRLRSTGASRLEVYALLFALLVRRVVGALCMTEALRDERIRCERLCEAAGKTTNVFKRDICRQGALLHLIHGLGPVDAMTSLLFVISDVKDVRIASLTTQLDALRRRSDAARTAVLERRSCLMDMDKEIHRLRKLVKPISREAGVFLKW